MIKAKLSFFWTSNSEGYGSHGNKCTILILGSVNFAMSVNLQNFILLKSIEYIKSYRYLSALCWNLWIQIFSTLISFACFLPPLSVSDPDQVTRFQEPSRNFQIWIKCQSEFFLDLPLLVIVSNKPAPLSSIINENLRLP